MDASILIVSYNTRDYTLRCLESVHRQARGVDHEVVVVDNASADGSAEAIAAAFPTVRLVVSSENLGFARAVNRAAEDATGEYLLLLNPDTELVDDAVTTIVGFARGLGRDAIVGGRTLHADGTLNPTSCWKAPTPWSTFSRGIGLATLLPRSRWFDPESLGHWQRDSVREVEIVSGCFMLVRRETWRRLGGFDPVFFVYGEDADLCLRAARIGVPCILCPDARVVHHGGASEPVRAGKLLRLFRAKSQVFDRHWSRVAAASGRFSLTLWCLTRLVATWGASRLSARHAASHSTWRAVWRGRAAWLRPHAPPLAADLPDSGDALRASRG